MSDTQETNKITPQELFVKEQLLLGEHQVVATLDVVDGSIHIPSLDVTLTRFALVDIFRGLKKVYGGDFLKERYFNKEIPDFIFKRITLSTIGQSIINRRIEAQIERDYMDGIITHGDSNGNDIPKGDSLPQ